jgi:addiction module RelE/StbE family toxin
MKIFFTAGFAKKFHKMPPGVQRQFEERVDLFGKDPSHPTLKAHPLKGNLAGLRAFAVSGNYRVIYRLLDPGNVEMVSIGKHSQVYK